MLLRLRGHDVQTAYDGRQTLETVQTFRPHVVLLDIALPHGMDGYEVARRIRKQAERPAPTIVAMTGYGQPEDVARAARRVWIPTSRSRRVWTFFRRCLPRRRRRRSIDLSKEDIVER